MSTDEKKFLVSPGPLWKRIMKRTRNRYRPVIGWISPKGRVSIFDNGTFMVRGKIKDGKVVSDFDRDELNIGLVALGTINPQYRDVQIPVKDKENIRKKYLMMKQFRDNLPHKKT